MIRFATFLLVLSFLVSAQDGAFGVRTEVERQRRALKDHPIQDAKFPNANADIEEGLKASADALDAGRLYLSLELLGRAINFAEGIRSAVERSAAMKGGLEAFESEWGKVNTRVAALAQERSAGSTAALRALAETARSRTAPLLAGSHGFAIATEPADGLFYLGQAFGEAEFARFCASLQIPARGRAFRERSMLPELQALQDKTNAAFQPPRSIELHSRFIALNSALKLAWDLDASRSYAGSLYQYLEAVRHYAMLSQPPLDAAHQGELKQAVKRARENVAASQQDDSIAELFIERAQSQVAHADGSAPTADEWRSARVIVDHVLPAYFEALKPPPATARATGKTIDITLVRWPYT